MRTKVCFKCEAELPITNFYKHPQMGDGYLGKCKACARYDVRQNRKAKVEYYREYDRQRSKDPKRVEGIVASKKRHPEKKHEASSSGCRVSNAEQSQPTHITRTTQSRWR